MTPQRFSAAVARGWLIALLLVAPCAIGAADELLSELHEQIVQVPLAIDGAEIALTATIFRPDGAGPFPLIVLSHGNPVRAADRTRVGRYRKIAQIRAFLERGFAVIVPIRRGFGATGGTFAEDYGSCTAEAFYRAGLAAANDVIAAST